MGHKVKEEWQRTKNREGHAGWAARLRSGGEKVIM